MRLSVARTLLIGIGLAGCLRASPAIECFDVRSADCELAANAALPQLPEPPDRLVVTGMGTAFVVVGCYTEGVAVVDVRVAENGGTDARVREHGPDMRHLCDNDPRP